ncbi:PREDICTED: uncharacterized protein LOC104816815 isoform X2 [Tarenaya hassleriana]|uniref:uncharacterized protein LOC104816815 isoform X2 n=1 Tax=Tarenaya hassleriana TaxID=28532 RepID=UPI00053C30FC|nr:PREDICTED: uncharacterized protein LOC104816815 isoform X2 [Tarenaya hassleriana]XP_010544095.1 PREDICTED: uncharacterized protein LOC104816815 isoform X2 [Tarenaya hassleriana]
MNVSSSGRSSMRSWSIYTTRDGSGDREGPWSSSSSSSSMGTMTTSMNAISFGFVATAILISMFLIMAIFEHLFRPDNSSFDSPHRMDQNPDGSAAQFMKLPNQAATIPATMAADVSVVMPGAELPSHIALPAPLPCRREGVRWPSHHFPS